MRCPLCLRTPLLSASCRIPTTPARLETLSPSNTLRPGQLGKLPVACLRRSPRARSSLLILSSASAACSQSPGSTATVLLKCQGRPGAHLSKSEQLPSCAHSCLVALRAGSLGQGLPGTGVCGAGRGPNNGTPPKLGPCSVLSSPASLLEESVHLWALTFTSILVALGLYLT